MRVFGTGLSEAAIVGLAAGIPCVILLLLLIAGLVLLCYYCYKKKSKRPHRSSTDLFISPLIFFLLMKSVFSSVTANQNPRYPVARAVKKVSVPSPNVTNNK